SAGTIQTITWDVANTDIAPVNATTVDILITDDGGETFTTIVSDVTNEGSEIINIPAGIPTSTARIMVRGHDNIFFAINSADITIQDTEFVMIFDETNKGICSPNSEDYTFTYNTFFGFNENTTFSASGNPAGTTVTFNPTSATNNGTSVTMTVSGITDTNLGNHTITVTGTATSVTKDLNVSLGIFTTSLTTPTLASPLDNAVGVMEPYTLSWDDDSNTLNYDVEISTDSGFGTTTESVNVSTNSYDPQLLSANTQYYWRVKAKNDCAESSFSTVFNFTTANISCGNDTSTDTPLDIPDDDTGGVSSVINISAADNKTIADVNVTVNITHPWIGDLTLTLTNHQGTEIILVSNRIDSGDDYTNTVFDDEATATISSSSAPYTGSFTPQGSLSSYSNLGSSGNWTLKAVDGGEEDFGTIDDWTLEICGVSAPFLDDDGDNVMDSIDLCPETPENFPVDASGCFTLPSNNYSIETIGETCPDSNNGQIIISATAN
ncbi:MAG: hypothetical protein GY787_12310, partial [Alteromonadales bacterium]|nr:hypothetical protein [Alteromonadales bacterium]